MNWTGGTRHRLSDASKPAQKRQKAYIEAYRNKCATDENIEDGAVNHAGLDLLVLSAGLQPENATLSLGKTARAKIQHQHNLVGDQHTGMPTSIDGLVDVVTQLANLVQQQNKDLERLSRLVDHLISENNDGATVVLGLDPDDVDL